MNKFKVYVYIDSTTKEKVFVDSVGVGMSEETL